MDPDSITVTVEMGNDAMQTPEDAARALERIAGKLRLHGWNADLRALDVNGNTVATGRLDAA